MAFKRYSNAVKGNFGRQTVSKTPSVLGRLVGKDNPDGPKVWDKGVKVRGRRR